MSYQQKLFWKYYFLFLLNIKIFLKQNVKENYHRSLQLWSMAVAQFKRYNCEVMQHIAFINMADDYVEMHKLSTALQVFFYLNTKFYANIF